MSLSMWFMESKFNFGMSPNIEESNSSIFTSSNCVTCGIVDQELYNLFDEVF